MKLAVETRGLVKLYGATRAVDGVSLQVQQGTIYGVLGPNGAGKTTTVRVLATLLPYEGGDALVLGHDVAREPDAVRKKISLTGQYASVDEDLTAFENLILLGRLLGLGRRSKARALDLIEAFDLADAAPRQVKTFSGGQRRRLDIAASIVVTPDLLFLDEPTTGLDPRSRNDVWELIRTLVAGGTTVLLTTQYLEEADQLADRIAVIDHGKVIAEGTSDDLKRSVGAGALHVRVADAAQRDAAQAQLQQALGVPVVTEVDLRGLKARLPQGADPMQALQALHGAGIVLTEFSLGQPSLDEVFFALTGHAAEPEAQP